MIRFARKVALFATRAVRSQTGLHGGRDAARSPSDRPLLDPRILVPAFTSILAYVLLVTILAIIFKNELPWNWRVALFGACAVLCVPICLSHSLVASYLTRWRSGLRRLLPLTASTGLSASSTAVLVYGTERLFRAGSPPHRLRDVFALALVGMLLCASVAQYAAYRRRPASSPTAWFSQADRPGHPDRQDTGPAEGAGPRGDRFFSRLPAALGQDVVYLKMRDHYVDVFTTAGHGSVLMRFGDAVADLEGLGLRVHRSYWVGHGHLERLEQVGSRSFLRISGGRRVPVSRTYRQAVMEALA